ncbi:MAG: hypothetical protein K8H88_06125 [Sandaracinaceae bacterium]|nr:hypothetical protein [Sandaracinaceae bacterium]
MTDPKKPQGDRAPIRKEERHDSDRLPLREEPRRPEPYTITEQGSKGDGQEVPQPPKKQ